MALSEHRLLYNTQVGPYLLENGGEKWSWVSIYEYPFGVGFPTVRDSRFQDADPSIMYIAFLHRVYRSVDAGETWSCVFSVPIGLGPHRTIWRLAVDPEDGDRVVVYQAMSGSHGLAHTEDGGATWRGAAWPYGWIEDLTYAASGVLVAIARKEVTQERSLLMSTDDGDTWEPIATGMVGMRLDVVPGTPAVLYLAKQGPGGGLFRTPIDEIDWQELDLRSHLGEGAEWIWDVTVDPSAPYNIYVLRTEGIYASTDDGLTWHPSAPFPEFGTGEGTVAELSDGRIYYNSRLHWGEAEQSTKRRSAYSRDGGETWQGWRIVDVLPDGPQESSYGCMGGLVRLPVRGRDILIFSNLDTPGSRRERLTVWASFDGGATWPVKRLVDEGPSAYSSLSAGRPETASEGWIYLQYESRDSQLARFNLAWLRAGEPTGDGQLPNWLDR
jgi:hypothetical protein